MVFPHLTNFLLLIIFCISICIKTSIAANVDGLPTGLSDNIRIASKHLTYQLQYRVYLPPNYHNLREISVVYLTDGQSYIHNGEFHLVMDRLIKNNKIEPIIAVFIDPRDPEDYSMNRRNYEFFCNGRYIDFVNNELIKEIEQNYNVSKDPHKRVMMGLSFGGLNAGCFGLLSHHTFRNIVMQSPAMHPIPNLLETYRESPPPPLNVYISTGTINDGEKQTQRFKRMLKQTGHKVRYKSTRQGHNWRNWRPMLDNILLYYFGKEDSNN